MAGDGEEDDGVYAGLPAAVTAPIPELARLPVVGEARATCLDCVMVPARMNPAAPELSFDPNVRCCTYHPELPNFLAGRALNRGGRGAALLRARIAGGGGVSAWGVVPDAAYRRAMAAAPAFGRSLGRRCPLWVAEDGTCGIWRDRNGVCRSWFCRHDDGRAGAARWLAARAAVERVERALATRCIAAGEPPAAPASPAAWEAWFAWCAAHVDGVAPAWAAADASLADLGSLRRALAARIDAPVSALPPVVVADLGLLAGDAARVSVCGYRSTDVVEGPGALLDFFDALDGHRTWSEAAAGAGIARPLVAELHRIDALREPAPRITGPVPEMLSASLRRPFRVGERVVLQGAPGTGCVVTQPSVFETIARLDGRRAWREVLGATPPEIVERLYRIGALSGSAAGFPGKMPP